MSEWFCKKCSQVTNANDNFKCCGGELAVFDPKEHGRFLIGGNNGWIMIAKAWREKFSKNDLISEVSEKLIEDQCHSSATHMIKGIEALIEFYEETK